MSSDVTKCDYHTAVSFVNVDQEDTSSGSSDYDYQSVYNNLSVNVNNESTIIAFVNVNSGGQEGRQIIEQLEEILGSTLDHPKVFDLIQDKGAMTGLNMYRDVERLKVIVCGGDGSVGWVLNEIDNSKMTVSPSLAVLPLGTGNDMARFLKWGSKWSKDLRSFVMKVREGIVICLDRWSINSIVLDPNADGAFEIPQHIFYNYFSIGVDAEIALDFHLRRSNNPEKFKGRFGNMIQYGKISIGKLFDKRYLFGSINDDIKLEVDGKSMDRRMKQIDALLFLNIKTYAGGTKPWTGKFLLHCDCMNEIETRPQRCDDGYLEIIGFRHYELANIRLGYRGRRICQGKHIVLFLRKSMPVEVDGEPVLLKPSKLVISRKNQALVIRRKLKNAG